MLSTRIKPSLDLCAATPALGGRDKRMLGVLWLVNVW